MLSSKQGSLRVIVVLGLVFGAKFTKGDGVPNSSRPGDAAEEVCKNDGSCEDDTSSVHGWKPFRISQRSRWISFEKLVERYEKWHRESLLNEDISCQEKKVLVFTPNAGLGDSIGALTTSFIYAIRSGRLFFIDWQPFPWSLMFKDLSFDYDYRKAMNMNGKSRKPLICPSEEDPSSFLSGHVTSQHPLVDEAKGHEFQTDYISMSSYFLKPAKEVQKVLDGVILGPFKNVDEEDTILHKAAIVMRTGIGEYNQFLSIGDEENFVACFKNYAKLFKKRRPGKEIKFAVFVTSDNADAKKNAISALENLQSEMNLEIVTLEDSAIHVMHMTQEESKETEIRKKLQKTIAEFFLIGMCDVQFLTHGSLFGRAAAERGGGREENTFFISDSNCDGKREKYSYLECHSPKYPPICGFS